MRFPTMGSGEGTGVQMDRTRRSEFFWFILIAGCVALFVAHRERSPKAHDHAQRSAVSSPVHQMHKKPVDPNAEIVTGSITPRVRVQRAKAELVKPVFYVPLGSYGSIDKATRRYLDLAAREPSSDWKKKIKIETVAVTGYGTFHRVRMGNFATVSSARTACVTAGLSAAECSVVESRETR